MVFSSTLLSLALCSIGKASHLLDVTGSAHVTLREPSISSTCSFQDLFYILATKHDHEGFRLRQDPSTYSPPIAEPWTMQPTCSDNNTEEFCVFTSSDFAHNRGISILTKPSIASALSRLEVFSSAAERSSSSLQDDPRSPPFEIVQIPGRGLGVIANRTIERGDLIKICPATLLFHNDAVDRDSPDYVFTENLMRTAVDQLPEGSRQLFLSMAAHDESGEPYIERIYTNTFGEDFGGDEHSVVVPETARINHDCRPNAMYYFDHRTLSHYTHASRTIYAGEEVTITYIDPLQTRLERRDALKRSWGFDCSCSLCTQSQEFSRESDHRIREIKKLMEAFRESEESDEDETPPSSRVNGTPEMAELLISLYEQERLHSSMTEPYRLAALGYSAVGNEWMAVKWAMKAVEAGLISDGPTDYDVKDMRSLRDAPKDHWSWGINIQE